MTLLTFIYVVFFLLSCFPGIILYVGLAAIRSLEQKAIEMPHHHGIIEASAKIAPVLEKFERIMFVRLFSICVACLICFYLNNELSLLIGIFINAVTMLFTKGTKEEVDLVVAYGNYIYGKEIK